MTTTAGRRAAPASARRVRGATTTMSDLHVYGVVPAAAAGKLAEDGVRLIVHRDVAALVSDIDRHDLRAVRVLRMHWRVLEAVSTSTTVLPVRFGPVMAGDRAVVEEFLEPSYDALAAALAELTGK